ncbi:hypothetical protein EJB05_46634 [Eragrostis curvula]|uniref:Protein transport protein sec16 n=1 Tax=Eragrostis curvula TaxID=38414 RepID=A0A5J9TNZ4_9POAL|nr:hypothetical protein EJB05_46634 [Eragrostis curvula]
MASDSDDADFFDKLVDSDDDDDRQPPPSAAADEVEASAGDLAALTLADQPPDPVAPAPAPADPGAEAAAGHPEAEVESAPPPTKTEAEPEPAAADPIPESEAVVLAQPAVVHPESEAVVLAQPAIVHPVPEAPEPTPKVEAPEGGSPQSSDKGGHTAIKQVQWNDFGASSGADPFGDLLADGAEDAFFEGAVPGDQALQASLQPAPSAVDHSFSSAVDNNANSHWDSSASAVDHSNNAQLDSVDPKYWESLYPGWKYDEATQQWYQVDTLSAQQNAADNTSTVAAHDNVQQQQQQFGASYVQTTSHAALETIAEESSAATWAQDGSYAAPTEYPPNMLFYADYPGWYFDTNTQQWQSLESYQQTVAQTAAALDGFAGTGHIAAHTQDSYTSSYAQQSQWQPGASGNSMQPDGSADNSLLGSFYGSENQIGQQADPQPLQSSTNYINTFVPSTSQYTGSEGLQPSASHQSAYQVLEQSTSDLSSSMGYQSGYTGSAPYTGHQGFKTFTNNQSWTKGFGHSAGQEVGNKGFEPSAGYQTGFEPSKDHQASHMAYEPLTNHGYGSFDQKEQSHADSATHMHLPNNYWGTRSSGDFAQQQSIGPNGPSQQFGFSPHEQRSSAGRPPHALVTFGFGGKLIVLKDISSITATFDSRSQGNSGRTVSILNVPEIVADKIDHSIIPSSSVLSYFHALCRHPIPGPLVGGNAAAKDVSKWLDDTIGGYESSLREFQGRDVQKLLISLLKILCQHYGKLRSPFGSDPSQEGIDGPEMAVTKLFASYKSNANMKGYGAVVHCVKNIPLESQIQANTPLQATAQEVQNLLVSGRRKEALQCAQEGQLWGPAIILALQLGDKFYADTVKKMAHCHFVSGSPLRTLCLLIAGQPADIFNFEDPVGSGSLHSGQPPVEAAPKGMLDEWQENLAILIANRTKGDDLVITHLGDCLWKERNEVASAHSCYLVAELNIDSYSESARMCLIGADHLRCPRTFASPEAIQRTEVYEYAKVLGNSQYILLPFQPYKLMYAYMLAEVGKVSDSLRYCQASLKVLKASGRAPELETWKQLFSSLEERIRTHQQGGYAINLAPGKIVEKIFTSLDKSLFRMMGTQSAPLPQPTQGTVKEREISAVPDTKVVNTQSVMSMSPLMSSTSELSMSEISDAPDRKVAHNRSISEPDFGRAPQQGAGSGKTQSTSGSGSSRFGWLVQKTMGLVSKSSKQAKLGEQNKFYYDEKLKRWVEEGAEVPVEEPPLPPPPTKASFQNSVPDYNLSGPVGGHTANGFADAKTSNPAELSSGMPPIPPTQNQFSARGRMGVRSRYVDTFNKGSGASAFGAPTSFSKPAASSMSPLSGAKFFVPTPAAVAPEQTSDTKVDAHVEATHQDETSSSTTLEAAFSSPPPSALMPSTIQRYPSMDNIMTPSDSGSSSLSKSRAASWSGTYPDQFSSTAASRSPDGQTMQSPLMPGKRPPHSRSSSNSSAQFGGMGEDLHEVEL